MPMRTALAILTLLVAGPSAAAPDWWTMAEPASSGSTVDVIAPCARGAGSTQGSACLATRTNWVEGWLEVRAEATADRRRCLDQAHCFSVAAKTARHLAYEKLAEVIDGLSIDGRATYGRELMRSSELRTSVKSFIRGAREMRVDQGTYSDGSFYVGVNLGLSLRGPESLTERTTTWYLAQPEAAPGRSPVATPSPSAAAPPAPVPESAAPPVAARQQAPVLAPVAPAVAEAAPVPPPVPPPAVAPRVTVAPTPAAGNVGATALPRLDERYSGVIIDCSGFNVRPCIYPRVVTPSGRVVYGLGVVRDKAVERHGLVDWAADLASARKMKRVGRHPLVVKALGTGGDGSADIIVSEDAAALIAATVGRDDFHREGRVVISVQ